jgi:hypothetical protein
MRWELLAGAMSFASVATPSIALAQTSDIVPPQPKAARVKCDPPLPTITAPVCCLVATDISAEGKAVAARATCSDPAFEKPVALRQGAESFVPATQAGRPIPFTARIRMLFGEDKGNAADLCKPLFSNPPG